MLAKGERERQRAEELREHERAWGPPPDQFDEWPSEIRVAPADQAGAPVAPAPAIKEPGGEEAPKTKASKPKPETKDKPPQKPREGWAQYLQLDEKGQPVANLANVLTALRGAPELSNLMAFDAMMRQLMFKRSIAGCKIKDAKDLRAVEDAEVTALQEWLQRHDIKRVSKETVQQAVELIGRENAFHPVKDYLSGVKWDG
jgi:predicted P-loop ATPase